MTFVPSAGGGGGGLPGAGFSSLVVVDETNDGDSTVVDTLYGLGQADDFGLLLPATAGLNIGDQVHFICADGGTSRCVISCDDRGGADTEVILGAGSGGTQYHILAGNAGDMIVFEYMGTGFGAPFWLATYRDRDLTDPSKAPVRLATTVALPAYAVSGTEENVILTASANGALTVDGVAVASGGPFEEGILLRHGAATADNGIYQVLEIGDGSNPFILRQRLDWTFDFMVSSGTIIPVSQGSTLAGNIYVTDRGESIGSFVTADFVVNGV